MRPCNTTGSKAMHTVKKIYGAYFARIECHLDLITLVSLLVIGMVMGCAIVAIGIWLYA